MPDDDDNNEALYNCSVQAFARWSANCDDDDDSAPPKTAEVFVFQDPSLVDLLSITGAKLESQRKWLRWETRASDVDGCLSLHSAKSLGPRGNLSDRSVLVLLLPDALEAQGYRGELGKVTHHLVGARQYACRRLESKRTFLQAVLAAGELFAAGVPSFASGRPSAYYALLLKTKKLPDPFAGAVVYKKKLAEMEGDPLTLKLLEKPAGGATLAIAIVAKPRRDRGKALLEVAGEPGSSDDDVALHPPPLPPSPPPCPPASIEVGGDDGIAVVVADRPRLLPKFPREICGRHVKRIKGRQGGGWSYFDGASIKCNNPAHEQCQKSRSLALDMDIFGPRSAEHFLACWLSRSSDMPQSDHKQYAPSRDEVRKYIDSCD
eukprot:TRINITY_DN74779_c0_g1_i1.p1 TRINITY_DN74779_c0_g1~~TRINITY_DN74779_c0_g1_i1.p1  ORF type:complete len:377 (+),score=74.07 TRINITY_DN74779_c0_g1_i1:167-1297(+)